MDILKYNFEYCCSPIWIVKICNAKREYSNPDIAELNIDEFLKKEMIELERIYQSTYNQEDGRESGFINNYQHAIFVDRVLCSARLLKIALAKEYEIIFDKEHWEDWRSRINKNLDKF